MGQWATLRIPGKNPIALTITTDVWLDDGDLDQGEIRESLQALADEARHLGLSEDELAEAEIDVYARNALRFGGLFGGPVAHESVPVSRFLSLFQPHSNPASDNKRNNGTGQVPFGMAPQTALTPAHPLPSTHEGIAESGEENDGDAEGVPYVKLTPEEMKMIRFKDFSEIDKLSPAEADEYRQNQVVVSKEEWNRIRNAYRSIFHHEYFINGDNDYPPLTQLDLDDLLNQISGVDFWASVFEKGDEEKDLDSEAVDQEGSGTLQESLLDDLLQQGLQDWVDQQKKEHPEAIFHLK